MQRTERALKGRKKPDESLLPLRARRHLLRLDANKRIGQRRQRIESGGIGVELLRFVLITLGLVGLAQAIQIARVLLVGLLQLRNRGVVIFLGQGNSARQFMGQLHLRRILRGLSPLTIFIGVGLRRRVVLLPNRQRSQIEMMQELGIVFDLLRQA